MLFLAFSQLCLIVIGSRVLSLHFARRDAEAIAIFDVSAPPDFTVNNRFKLHVYIVTGILVCRGVQKPGSPVRYIKRGDAAVDWAR